MLALNFDFVVRLIQLEGFYIGGKKAMTLGKGMFRLFSCVLTCVFFALGATCVAHAYEVTYDCGAYSDGVSVPPDPETVSANASFTPAANTCVSSMPNDAQFVGWAVSKTTDIRPAGQAFNWNYDEDKTFTAIWSCWPNEDLNECLSGYTITLTKDGCANNWSPPSPDKLYTIQNVGVYIGPERTYEQLMEPQVGGRGGRNNITNPHATFVYNRDIDTYAPTNPVTGQLYDRGEPLGPISTRFNYNFTPTLSQGGYILANSDLVGINSDTTVVSRFGGGCGDAIPLVPQITGYTISWHRANGTKTINVPCNTDCSEMTGTLYAHWTKNTYNIRYELGDIGEWGANAVHPDSATYDTEFEVSHPVSTRAGYIFDGWNITNLNDVRHYASENPIFVNNVFQSSTPLLSGTSISGTSATHFMNLRSVSGTVTFTPAWRCDTENGYHWVNDECSNEYNIYYSVTDAPGNFTVPNTETVTAGTTGHSLGNAPTSASTYTCTSWSCTDSTNQLVAVTNNTIDMPAADVTCTASCGCNPNPSLHAGSISLSNDLYWNSNKTECMPAYTVWIFNSECYDWNPPVPSAVYSVYQSGVYIGPERTNAQLMKTQSQNGGQNPIQLPTVDFNYTFDTTSNIPINPVTGVGYANVSSVSNISYSVTMDRISFGQEHSIAAIDSDGYITSHGYDVIRTYNDPAYGPILQARLWDNLKPNLPAVPEITGYQGNWYRMVNGEKQYVTTIETVTNNGRCPTTGMFFAEWTPKTYNIQYVLGSNASWGAGAVHPTSADYDTEFLVSVPSTSTGYRFTGWNITNMDTSTHYYSDSAIVSNNVYQQGTTTSQNTSLSGVTETHFMNLRANQNATVVFTAQIECDEGYEFVSGECKKKYTVTYDCGSYMLEPPATVFVGEYYNLEYASNCMPPSGECALIPGSNDHGWNCNTGTNNPSSPGYSALTDGDGIWTLEYDYICHAPWYCCDAGGHIVSNNTCSYPLEYQLIGAPNNTPVPSGGFYPSGSTTLASIPSITGYACSSPWSCTTDNGTNPVTVTTSNNTMTISMPLKPVLCTSTCSCDTAAGYYSDGNGGCSNNYTLTYVVNAPQDADITVPTNNPVTVTAGTTYYQLEDKPSGTGYTCTKWSCEYANNQSLTVNDSNQLLFIPASNITCTSTCTANNINLIWNPNGGTMDNDNPDSCAYWDEDGISTVYQPNKPGYSFLGWLITGWTDYLLGIQDFNLLGTDYAYTGFGGECGGYSIQQPQTPNLYGLYNQYCPSGSPGGSLYGSGHWAVGFVYGIVRGEGGCSSEQGTQYEPGEPNIDNNGQYCWCRLNSYTTADLSVTEQYNDLPWVYLEEPSYTCKNGCAGRCANAVHNSSMFRSALYGQSQ